MDRSLPKITSIEAARGIASLMVVLYHLPNYGKKIELFPTPPFGGFFAFGHAGVDFFFVLSGFIITYVHLGDVGRPSALVTYAWKRFSRILPLYWLVLAIVVALVFLMPGYGQDFQRTAGVVLRSALLWDPARGAELSVAWSLSHEMLFYAVFGLAILSRSLGILVFGAWMVLVCVQTAIRPDTSGVVLSFYNIEFLFGAAAAILVRRARIPAPWALLGLGVAGFLLSGLAEDFTAFMHGPVAQRLGYGLSAMLMVCGMVQLSRDGALPVPRALTALGNASYSLYLVHTWVLSIVLQALISLGVARAAPPEVVFVLMAAGTVAAGLLCYRFVERPLILASRRVSRGLSASEGGVRRSPLAEAAGER